MVVERLDFGGDLVSIIKLWRLFIASTSLGEFMNWALFIGSPIAFTFKCYTFTLISMF